LARAAADSSLALFPGMCTIALLYPMKTFRLVLTLAVAAFVAAAVQAEEKKEAPVSKPANCCAKAEAKGEKCTHECCVEAAKAGNNCTDCKGSGKIEPKK